MLVFRPWLGLFIFTCLLATPARPQAPPTPPASTPDPGAYVKLGEDHIARGDLNGAIASFDEALRINPKWASAYENKGEVLMRLNKLDEAVTNFNQAIQYDPSYLTAYYERGVAQGGLTHFDAAIGDFSHIIDSDPKNAQAFRSRGFARYFKGDFDGAVADTTQALALNSNLSDCYLIRGLAKRGKHDREGQTTDFQESATGGFAYGAFWFWIVKMEQGEEGTARSTLSDYLTKHEGEKNDWTRHVGDFLLERMRQDELVGQATADNPAENHLSEAWFFIGMDKKVRGDLKGAQDAFTKAIASGSKQSVEYAEAQRELGTLEQP